MIKANNYSYINKNGKKVAGAAALAHYIYTEIGGMEKYDKMIKSEHIKELAFRSLGIATVIVKSISKKKFF